MKKFLSIILISICFVMILIGCNRKQVNDTKESEKSDEIIKVMENVYVDYINDIYLDSKKYLGKTIELEGMFTIEKDKENKEHLYVYRLADMVENIHKYEEDEYNKEHAHDHEEFKIVEGICGLEFLYDKNLPKESDWIKVRGKLKEKDGTLVIDADFVEVMKERGLEKVTSFY